MTYISRIEDGLRSSLRMSAWHCTDAQLPPEPQGNEAQKGWGSSRPGQSERAQAQRDPVNCTVSLEDLLGHFLDRRGMLNWV